MKEPNFFVIPGGNFERLDYARFLHQSHVRVHCDKNVIDIIVYCWETQRYILAECPLRENFSYLILRKPSAPLYTRSIPAIHRTKCTLVCYRPTSLRDTTGLRSNVAISFIINGNLHFLIIELYLYAAVMQNEALHRENNSSMCNTSMVQ
ncbi:unnamed protein product [Trichogramma brassicae]|uniref:Uncharacterized protein n=1 Tax=Trichogramma brassicae TaxID=86971 RepID=A0A6H5HZD6_9HYME|nr:unnamed protein product [Trichogramma brassicae]